jgi:hypothetical protein
MAKPILEARARGETRYFTGVRVKCVKIGEWVNGLDGSFGSGPSIGSVWTVKQVVEWAGEPYLVLEKWPDPLECFSASWFVPLDGSEDMTDLEAALKGGPPIGDKHDSDIEEIIRGEFGVFRDMERAE